MAIVTAYPTTWSDPGGSGGLIGQDLNDLYIDESLREGHVVEATSSLYTIVSHPNDVLALKPFGVGDFLFALNRFAGSDFTYDASHKLIGGVVTGWEHGAVTHGSVENPDSRGVVTGWEPGVVTWEQSVGQIELFSVAGLSVPATTFASWIDIGAVFTAPILLGGDDGLTGTPESEMIWGYAGNDTIDGGGSPSDVAAYASDYLRGGDGADVILGGVGAEDINGNQGDDTAYGGPGDDWVVGGKDDDVLHGDEGGDIVYGNLGNDTCDGGAGADTVRGGQGDDSLTGSAGDDWLSGDLGGDTLSGGAGADVFHTFVGAGFDRVLDFNPAEGDRVQIDPGPEHITLAQAGADTILYLGDGAGGDDGLILVGVALSSLTSMGSATGGWIAY